MTMSDTTSPRRRICICTEIERVYEPFSACQAHHPPLVGDQLVDAADRATAREVVAAWLDAGHLTSPFGLDELRAGIAAALAARPRRAP